MKSEDEIYEAHDRYVATILGEMPNPFHERDLEVMKAASDVLCWVLEHQHNQSFAENLKLLKDYHESIGITMSKHDN